MRPAFSSRTKRRGTTALALASALRLFFLTASDMWHLYGALTRTWSVLDRDCAANTCHDIEWDDRRWNGCASSSQSYSAARPCCALTHFAREGYFLAPVYGRFTDGFCDCGHADRASPARLAPVASSVTLICWRRPCARNSPWTSRPVALCHRLTLVWIIKNCGEPQSRDLGQSETADPGIRQGYRTLIQPDVPTASCCGKPTPIGLIKSVSGRQDLRDNNRRSTGPAITPAA
jgi:hypothetical protein